MVDKCVLIKRTYRIDEYGIERETQQESEIFCDVRDVSASEFFDASQQGLKPELRFDVLAAEYDSQDLVRYKGDYLSIYRVYLRSKDYIELYTTKDVGT